MRQRPKLNRGEDPVYLRLRETKFKDVDALMSDVPNDPDELDEALPGAASRAREQSVPLEQRKKRRHESQDHDPVGTRTDDDDLDAFIDDLSPEQRERVYERLIQYDVADDRWDLDLEDEDESEAGEEE